MCQHVLSESIITKTKPYPLSYIKGNVVILILRNPLVISAMFEASWQYIKSIYGIHINNTTLGQDFF